MLTVLVLLTVVLLLGLLGGLIASDWLLLPRDRRRLEIIASELLAEARIDGLTRSTLAAMRAVQHHDDRLSPRDMTRRSGP
jgi:hypothetical protein